jgi:alkaline phosphatase
MRSFGQKVSRAMSILGVAILVMALISTAVPMGRTLAADAVPVLILPIDKAQFLPGARFDFRVEVHAEALPENFKVTINGEDPSTFFNVQPQTEQWKFGRNETPSTSLIWRNLTAPKPGEYTVEVTAAATVKRVTWTVRQPLPGNAKNVILFIGDGMSIPLLTAARVMSRGIKEGTFKDRFVFEKFEAFGLINTSSVDSLMADSANTASAMNTGHVGSVNATGSYSDTSPDPLDDPRVETFASMVKRARGMAVGSVTTADISDATPAAVWAHGRDRRDLNRNTYLTQILDENMDLDVLMGGGGRRFIPKSREGSRRGDERDLFAEYEAAGYAVVTTRTEMNDAMANNPKKMLGIFHPSDMNVWLDRNVFTENLGSLTDQPGLAEMTVVALEILKQNPNGFYLQVEAASVDKQLHPMDFERTIADLIELDRAVAAAIDWLRENGKLEETLLVVTPDHGHGFDVYGTVDIAKFNAGTNDQERRQAIRVYGAAGYPTYKDENGDFFPDEWTPSVVMAMAVNNHPDFSEDFQVSPKPRVPARCQNVGEGAAARVVCTNNPDDDPNGITMMGNLAPGDPTGVHTLQDIPVFASGPGAERFRIHDHQREVFFAMAAAIGLDLTAPNGKVAAVESAPQTSTAGVSVPAELSGIAFLLIGIALGFAFSRRSRKVAA